MRLSRGLVRLAARLRLPARWPEVVELDGIKVAVRHSPLDRRARHQLLKGYYETAERELVTTFVEPGDRILELGASVGILTTILLRRVGETGRVVSVEADASLQRAFETQLMLNGLRGEWVGALCYPLWAAPVPARLSAMRFQPSASSLSGGAREGVPEPRGPAWRSAGEICRERGLEPTVVLVDLEGAEAAWTEARPSLPTSVRLLIVEFHPHLIGTRAAGAAAQAILDESFVVAGLRGTVLAFERRRP